MTETAIKRSLTLVGVGKAVLAIISILGVVGTVVGLWVSTRSENTQITAGVLAIDELTRYEAVSGLEGQFTYAGMPVKHLWKLRVELVNSGDRTVVGEGNLKNIVGEGLSLTFPEETTILQATVTHDMPDKVVAVVDSQSNFLVKFSQWRSGESVMAELYVASEEPTEDLFPVIRGRDIVDGEVVVKDYTGSRHVEPSSALGYLPNGVATAGKIVGCILAAMFAVLFVFMLFAGWRYWIRLATWKRENFNAYAEYLSKIEPPLAEKRMAELLEKPYKLDDTLWTQYGGKRAPTEGLFAFDSLPQALFFAPFFLFFSFGLVCLILAVWPT